MQVLAEAHSLNLIHRDVKGGNVIIDTDTKTLKLIDWGLAEVYQPNSIVFSKVGM